MASNANNIQTPHSHAAAARITGAGQGHRLRRGEDLLLSALLLLLLLEWLYPLSRLAEITELHFLWPFVATFSLFVLLDAFRLSPWLTWPVKIVWSIFFTVWLHHGQALPSAAGWGRWGQQLQRDVLEGLQGNLAAWEPSTRTLLFTIGWAFFISVVQSLVLDRRSMHWLIALTVSFPIFLQMAFGLDALGAVARSTIIGLLLQLALQPERLRRWQDEAEALPSDDEPSALESTGSPRPRHIWLSGLLTIGLGAAAGLAASFWQPHGAEQPDWARAARLWQHVEQSGWSMSGSARTGYGSDDRALGQPLEADGRIAFTAVTDEVAYWRGESKSVYTGQGWTEPEIELQRASLPAASSAVQSKPGFSLVTQDVIVADPALGRMLFTGGELVRIEVMQTQQGRDIPDNWVWKHPASDRYSLPALSEPLQRYRIQAQVMTDRERLALQWASRADVPASIQSKYVQLPDTVTTRTQQLADRITAHASSPYEKATAIERYLRESYTYSTKDTRAVRSGEDLVDRFLFEQQSGYCDHFSTTMTVLLRSAGVPARWVKGFAPGEVVTSEQVDGRTVYQVQVRQLDAHSWVEAYIAGIGWVPFEPTPGFSGAAGSSSEAAVTAASTAPAARASATEADQPFRIASALHEAQRLAERVSRSASSAVAELWSAMPQNWQELKELLYARRVLVFAVLGVLLLVLVSLFALLLAKARMYELQGAGTSRPTESEAPSWWSQLMLSGGGLLNGLRRLTAHRHGDRLWRRLQRTYGPAAPNQTLREYASAIECRSESHRIALTKVALLLEAQRYGDPYEERGVTIDALRDAWQALRAASRSS
ncbi:transglutaminase domain-containing protein [Paenibacillus sp. YYML68]|uniref:DUF4129 domain-containing transglutaminase family protein n=1 Tax=Paenibacillus sp. YYML68 TaxID=2909250 RepID=UPI00248F89A2|nr:transglutaminase domain-containing protein [Paenibacillus sp. YYML68]